MENNKKTPVWAYITLGALIMFVGLGVVGIMLETDSNVTPVTPNTTEKPIYLEPDVLSQDYKDAFIEGCTAEGGSYEDCSCAIEYLDYTYGAKRVLDIAENYATTGILPAEVYEAVYACIDYYPTSVR